MQRMIRKVQHNYNHDKANKTNHHETHQADTDTIYNCTESVHAQLARKTNYLLAKAP